MNQRPVARDRGGLVERQRLQCLAGDLLPLGGRRRPSSPVPGTKRWRPRAATAASCRAARCGTSGRTCRDAPAHRRHRPWRCASAFISGWVSLARAATIAALNCRKPIAASSLSRPGEIAEMMGRCGMRHAGLARHRAQRQAGEPVALQHPLGRLQQRLVQVAMMIGGIARRAAPPARPAARPRPSPACATRSPRDGSLCFLWIILPCESLYDAIFTL